MANLLDDAATYARLDPSDLRGRIAGLPEQCRAAFKAASDADLPAGKGEVDRVVVLGMGGSGIGGALLRALAIDAGAAMPIEVVRSYGLPAYVGGSSLVVAASASGNTEETVSAFRAALDAGARCVAITTGGRLLALAEERGAPALRYEWAAEPRSALGWSFATLLAICGRLGVITIGARGFEMAVGEMEDAAKAYGHASPSADNAAKQIAGRLAGRLPVIVGAQALAPVAYRWRTQLNENGKTWAVSEELPEMNHNGPVGYRLPKRVVPLLHAVLLRHDAMHERIRHRVEFTERQMRAAGVSCEIVDVAGSGVLAQMLRAVQLGDFASYYAGLLNEVDPSPVEALDELKALMASR